MKLYVVTNPELGWDCVVGVYKAESEEKVIQYYADMYDQTYDEVEDTLIVHEETLDEI